jgi:hypothetical protein
MPDATRRPRAPVDRGCAILRASARARGMGGGGEEESFSGQMIPLPEISLPLSNVYSRGISSSAGRRSIGAHCAHSS